MDNNEIAEELRKRAEEMRRLPPGTWARSLPLEIGHECAAMRCVAPPRSASRPLEPLDVNPSPYEKTLTVRAERAVNRYIQHADIRHRDSPVTLTSYNDKLATCRADVAELLEKAAAWTEEQVDAL